MSLARTGRRQATFSAFYVTCRFITTFTTAQQLSLPQPNQSIPLPIRNLRVAACFFLVRLNTYQHRSINFFYAFKTSNSHQKFMNNVVIRQPIQGNTWDLINPNISPQLTSGGTNTEHELHLSQQSIKYKSKGKGLSSVHK